MSKTLSNKRIIHNTLYLYIRMAVMLLVQFYTLRVVLEVLGVDDFGLWTVIASLIVSFSFVQGPLTVATQRFLNYEIGCGGNRLNRIFSTSLTLFLLIGAVLFVALESVGVWFLNTHMNIAPEKLTITNWVFQFSILSFLAIFVRMPYESAIIAYERMSFYAVVCIVEVVLQLCIVYVLLFSAGVDKLVLYSVLIFVLRLVVTFCYKLYCNRNIPCTRFHFVYDGALMRQIASFSGWNLFGALSSAMATQGINVLMNLFFGVAVNAAYGVASQVGAALNSFIINFQKAVNPQIVKSYASGEIEYLHELLDMTCKYSFFLLFALVYPVIVNIDFLLYLWLGDNVTPYTDVFCQLTLVSMLIIAVGQPMDTAVFSTGKIKNSQSLISLLIFLNIVITYALFKTGKYEPFVALVVKCVIEVVIFMTRLWFIRKYIRFSFCGFFSNVVFPVGVVLCLTVGGMFGISFVLPYPQGWERLFFTSIVFLFIYGVCLWFVGMGDREKAVVRRCFKDRIYLKIRR